MLGVSLLSGASNDAIDVRNGQPEAASGQFRPWAPER
jgi:hypothetical protein